MSICLKHGHFCFVEKNPAEIPEWFTYRCYAITSGCPKTQSEYDKLINLSNHLINIKFLGCTYSNKINDECAQIDKNIFAI